MSKYDFSRGLDRNTLGKTIALLKEEHHKQIKGDLGKYQLCIRNNYINIYSNGCSLLKYNPNTQNNMLLVHCKYLNYPEYNYDKKSHYVPLDVNEEINFAWEKIKCHTSKEKEEIAKYLEAQKNKGDFLLIDLEIAFAREQKGHVADRIDMACIYLKDGKPILRLIEVKLTDDARLKSDQAADQYKEPKIMRQMGHYQDFIRTQESNIKKSYKTVAENYLEFIKQGIIPENYFSSIGELSPKEILKMFIDRPQLDERPYLLLLGPNCLTKGKNGQNHWQRLLELLENKYPKPELWPTEQCE